LNSQQKHTKQEVP
jgi:hypothetical protein